MRLTFNAVDHPIVDLYVLVSGGHLKHRMALAKKTKDFLNPESLLFYIYVCKYISAALLSALTKGEFSLTLPI